jgi:hypothetical protein
MKNNKLTLKSIQKELELLKATKAKEVSSLEGREQESKTSNAIGHDIKNSYINNLHMKSSMIYLYLVSWFLLFLNKVPYIKYIISILSLIYGRTTIWSILVRTRKFFIIINAVIGMYIVIKTVGINHETLLANFVALGNGYLEIITNLAKRLFNWFLEVFGYNIVPTEPSLPKPKFYNPWGGGMNLTPHYVLDLKVLPDWYKPNYLTINTNPWYKDLNTFIWISGILGSITLVYFGYKFICDPTFIADFFKKPGGVGGSNTPLTNIEPASPVNLDGGSKTPIAESVVALITGTLNRLNPYNWFKSPVTSESIKESFIFHQSSTDYDRRFYPFTEIHPYQPWYHRVKILVFGENTLEKVQRLELRDKIWKNLMPIALNDLRNPSNIVSGYSSPGLSNVGIGIKTISSRILELANTHT